MKHNPILAGVLSLLVPGLGQMVADEGSRGAVILVGAILIASLNIIFVAVFVAANPDPAVAWAYWIPRIGHDVVAVWSMVYWLWAVVDAVRVRERRPGQP